VLLLILLALTVGMLFTVNSWDFPTYLLASGACIAVQAFLSDDQRGWWRPPILVIGAMTAASVVFYIPFYAQFHSPTHGLGFVSTPSDVFEFLQVMGVVLLPAVLLIGSLALLFQPTGEVDERSEPLATPGTRASEAGTTAIMNAVQIALYALLSLVVIVVGHDHLWVVLLMLACGAGALFVLHRVLHAVEPSREDAVALVVILVACLVIAIPEVVYVRDVFDGGPDYRMNTLFKLYYQAWTLLGVVGAYAVYRGWSVLKHYFSSMYAWGAAGLIAAASLGGLYYTVNAPQSANQGGIAQSLDGSALLQANAPGDYAAVQWLRSHVQGHPVEMEATGAAYDAKFARISTFTGLPTVMGWADHEFQWRGADPDIQRRVDDIKTVYTTSNLTQARSLLRQYGVRYVIVGATEQQTYPGPGLTKFARFLRTAFSSGGTTVYTW
jgi:YYY domain-containing protein